MSTTWDLRPVLTGRHVRLRPIDVERDIPALFRVTPPDTFQYFTRWPRAWTIDEFGRFVLDFAGAERSSMFVVESPSGEVLGSTSYLDVQPANRSLEIGATWYALAARGTPVNPECKLLLLRHAFERLLCARVQLKTDERNLHSQGAIAKLGAVREGVLRHHLQRQDGVPRSSVMFSVLAAEWGAVKARLLARLGDAP